MAVIAQRLSAPGCGPGYESSTLSNRPMKKPPGNGRLFLLRFFEKFCYTSAMLFPELNRKDFALVNLNDEARNWLAGQSSSMTNPLLDSTVCQQFIDDYHQRAGTQFSFGGWLEDRSNFLLGSYLDKEQRYTHLGVDFNVPAGTRVAVNRSCKVIRIDDDFPEEHGWGVRVIVRDLASDSMIIYAHLDRRILVAVDDEIEPGTVIGFVGTPLHNGGWFPHLHVQVVDGGYYAELLKNDLRDLDGYGPSEDIGALKGVFFDPMNYVSI